MNEPWSTQYWEKRYAEGHHSGAGSYGKFAEFKASVLNRFVAENGVATVIELGSGDGAQLALAEYPDYAGYDVSETVLAKCRERFSGDPTKRFLHMRDIDGAKADLTLSLDVIYHLLEDDVFEDYMASLFDSARRFVIIYSSNTDDNEGYSNTHVWHRRFTDWVEKNRPGWVLVEKIDNPYPYRGDYRTGTFADFHIYRKRSLRERLWRRIAGILGR